MRVVGAILQGGRSRRMGVDKATVVVDGMTMRARVRAALVAVVDEVVQLGGLPPPGAADDVTDPVLHDPGHGPFLAVKALLESGRGDRYVVVAVDQPLIDPATLRRLLDVDVGADGAVCFEHEPLPCVLAAGALRRIESLAFSGERRVLALSTKTLQPTPSELRALTNVNTPHERDAVAEALRDAT